MIFVAEDQKDGEATDIAVVASRRNAPSRDLSALVNPGRTT
jgi:hypothetical protein